MSEQNKVLLVSDGKKMEEAASTEAELPYDEWDKMLEKILKEGQQKEAHKNAAEEIKSLNQAEQIVDTSDDADTITRIYERIIQGEISGDADNYHNIAVSFSRRQQSERACNICQAGLKKWPGNIDLNADALNYAMDAGLTDKLQGFAETLQKNCPDHSRWNWRGFRFLFMYYIKLKPKGYEWAAENLLAEYKKYLPADERAYLSESEWYQSIGKQEKAVQALEEAVKNMKAPQCALALTDLYFDRADYKNVLRTATLGIAYAAEPQPGIRTAYLLMMRAFALDADLLRSGNITEERVRRVLGEYELAKKYVSPREKKVIELRMDILKTYASLPNE